jgi:GDP-mannose 6-dehydrogenase
VQVIKRLLGEGCNVRVWDPDVYLGRLAGSNRQYIEEVIPHIGSLLSSDLEDVIRQGEVVVIGTKSADREKISQCLRPDQIVIDLVHLKAAHRPQTTGSYEGICW